MRNPGARFEQAAFQLITHAYEGDTLFFEDIQLRCPGDPEDRSDKGFQVIITCKDTRNDKVSLPQSKVQQTKNLDALYRLAMGLEPEPSLVNIDDHYIRDFHLTHIPRNGDSLHIQNKGNTFEKETLHYIQKAQPGDQFIFTKIRTENVFDSTWFMKDFHLIVGK